MHIRSSSQMPFQSQDIDEDVVENKIFNPEQTCCWDCRTLLIKHHRAFISVLHLTMTNMLVERADWMMCFRLVNIYESLLLFCGNCRVIWVCTKVVVYIYLYKVWPCTHIMISKVKTRPWIRVSNIFIYLFLNMLKEHSPIFSTFFKLFGDFGITKKSHIFLMTHSKFYGWKVFCVESISENLPGYGNHNKAGFH